MFFSQSNIYILKYHIIHLHVHVHVRGSNDGKRLNMVMELNQLTVGDSKFGRSHKKSALTLTKIRKTQKMKMNFIFSVV